MPGPDVAWLGCQDVGSMGSDASAAAALGQQETDGLRAWPVAQPGGQCPSSCLYFWSVHPSLCLIAPSLPDLLSSSLIVSQHPPLAGLPRAAEGARRVEAARRAVRHGGSGLPPSMLSALPLFGSDIGRPLFGSDLGRPLFGSDIGRRTARTPPPIPERTPQLRCYPQRVRIRPARHGMLISMRMRRISVFRRARLSHHSHALACLKSRIRVPRLPILCRLSVSRPRISVSRPRISVSRPPYLQHVHAMIRSSDLCN
eukprot:2123062-Rhodomonas_salina.1